MQALNGERQQEADHLEHKTLWRDGMNVLGKTGSELAKAGLNPFTHRVSPKF